jgi:hypothetical protein
MTQLHLIFLPFLPRHDDASSEGDATAGLEIVEAERADHFKWPIQPSSSAVCADLDLAYGRHGENSE